MEYDAVVLDAEDQGKLRRLNDTQQGLNNFIQTMMNAGETRAKALQSEGRELFEGFAVKYKLDLKRVTYVPSQDGTKLTPVAVRLVESGPDGQPNA